MNTEHHLPPLPLRFSWPEIDTLLLDMDGTLLDSYFDDYFWEEYVPEVYASVHALRADEAKERLLAKYQQVASTLLWADVDYWSEQLGLDIPALKQTIEHLIQVHPQVVDFLEFIGGHPATVHLVTNAHRKTLAIKLGKAALAPYFDSIIAAEQVGEAKEQPVFWAKLQNMLGFEPNRTLLVDDNSKVLRAASSFGLAHCIHVAKPSSRQPLRFSDEFPSIASFAELIR